MTVDDLYQDLKAKLSKVVPDFELRLKAEQAHEMLLDLLNNVPHRLLLRERAAAHQLTFLTATPTGRLRCSCLSCSSVINSRMKSILASKRMR